MQQLGGFLLSFLKIPFPFLVYLIRPFLILFAYMKVFHIDLRDLCTLFSLVSVVVIRMSQEYQMRVIKYDAYNIYA